MKTILGDLIGEKTSLGDASIVSIVVEEPKTYFDLCTYGISGFRGQNKLIKIFEEEKEIEPEYIENLFWPDLNTKRNLNALYKRLKLFGSEDLDSKLKEIRNKMESIVLEISMDFDGELTCEGDIKAEDLFKMFDLRFQDEDESGFSRLVKYISVSHELLKTEVFCVRGIHQCFSLEDLEQLSKELSYKKITLISIESSKPLTQSESERVFIIDKDLCTMG